MRALRDRRGDRRGPRASLDDLTPTVAKGRISPPRVAGGLVERERLYDKLDAAARGRVTVVTGPSTTEKVPLAYWSVATEPTSPRRFSVVAWYTLSGVFVTVVKPAAPCRSSAPQPMP